MGGIPSPLQRAQFQAGEFLRHQSDPTYALTQAQLVAAAYLERCQDPGTILGAQMRHRERQLDADLTRLYGSDF